MNRESGQAIVLVVVSLGLFMLGALGLGIDGAQMYAHRQMAQAAADAAAEAAIMSIARGTNSTSAHPFSTAASFTCAVPPATLDLRTPCVYAQDNGFGKSTDTVTVSFPTTISGVTLSAGATPAVSVSVQRVLTAGLTRFAGISTYTVKAKASAGILGTVPTQCVYVLDPSAQKAFTASGGATVTMNCGLAVNSSNADAADISGGATVTATAIDIAGGYSLTGGATASPAPTTGTVAETDPFASKPSPTPGSCDQTNYSAGGGGSFTLTPGTYCGGIAVGGGATATFNAGIYIIDGGSVNFSGGSTITGSGVMFYLTGTNASYGSVSISGGTNVTLSAETSGPYLGMLFYQDRSITSNVGAAFSGGSTMNLTGTLYFPTTSVTYSGGSAGTGTTAIVADKVSFSGGADLHYDPTGLKTGLLATTVGLVE